MRNNKKPKYIGFRVNLYTPDVTKELVESGDIGLTVVPANLNEVTPKTKTKSPAPNIKIDIEILNRFGTAIVGRHSESNHINTPKISANTKGGIFNSNLSIYCL